MFPKIARLAAFLVTLAGAAMGQVAILQIRFLAGEGAVHAPGSRSARPLTIEVTDETGKPVSDAAVSFHLPDEGPGGMFANGLRTEVALTDGAGRVSLHGLQVNRIPGRFQIRVVATKEQARAGVVSFQYVAEPGSGAASTGPVAARGRARWMAIAALVGGGAAAGILSAGRKSPASVPAPAPPVAATLAAPTVSIGAPATTVGKP